MKKMTERNSEIVRNGRSSRGPSPNNSVTGGQSNGNSETASSDDDNSKRNGNGKSKIKQGEYEEKIRVGREYQAVCPPIIPESERKSELLNERALLVWRPTDTIPDNQLNEFVSIAKEKYGYTGEQALGILFWHKYDLERATTDLANFTPISDEWTVEDKVLFEQAFHFHGKSFHRIRRLLPHKPIATLVKYYYSWKKTRNRESVMDRQEKLKAIKDSSDNGSDNGSNEESEDEKDDHSSPTFRAVLCDSESQSGSPSNSDSLSTGIRTPTSASLGSIITESSVTGAASSTLSGAYLASSSDTASVITDAASNGLAPFTNGVAGGFCSNCGVFCSTLMDSAHGKLCSSCHHHWTRTGRKRPTTGPFLSQRIRENYETKHKRKPPRGMYINHDDIIKLASVNNNSESPFTTEINRELVILMTKIQENKQKISFNKNIINKLEEETRPEPQRIIGRWTNDETQLAIQGIRLFGKDFQTIAEKIGTKTEAHLRSFYVSNRRRYNLDQLVKKFEADREAAMAAAVSNVMTNHIETDDKTEKIEETDEKNNIDETSDDKKNVTTTTEENVTKTDGENADEKPTSSTNTAIETGISDLNVAESTTNNDDDKSAIQTAANVSSTTISDDSVDNTNLPVDPKINDSSDISNTNDDLDKRPTNVDDPVETEKKEADSTTDEIKVKENIIMEIDLDAEVNSTDTEDGSPPKKIPKSL